MTAGKHTPCGVARSSLAETPGAARDEHWLTAQACESLRQREAELAQLKDDMARFVAWTPGCEIPAAFVTQLDDLKVSLAQVRATLGMLLESR